MNNYAGPVITFEQAATLWPPMYYYIVSQSIISAAGTLNDARENFRD